MGTTLITIKIMPESPQTNLNQIKIKAQEILKSLHGKNPRFEEHPIAFGLKALMLYFEQDEEGELDPIQSKLSQIPEVSSCTVTDMRRAFG